jgi:uncharacterized membrane protein YagU involved in acid resistance
MTQLTDTRKIAGGVASGLAATAPMTLAMVAMHQLLPARHRHALPPRHITENFLEGIGVRHHLWEKDRRTATLAAHFGYGAAMGGIFALFARLLPRPRAAGGIAWGLLVWAVSYMGVLPAARLHEPAQKHPWERNVLMIVAHIIWGGTLGWLMDRGDGW